MARIIQLKRAVRLVWSSAPGWTAANTVLLLVQGLLPVAVLYFIKLMLDAVAAALLEPDQTQAVNDLLTLIALTGGIALLNGLAQSLGSLVTMIQGRLVVDHMYDVLHDKAVEIDLEYYESPQYYDTFHRAQQEATFRPIHIVNNLAKSFQSIVSLVGIAWLLLTFHWGVIFLLVFAVVPSTVVRLRHSRRLYKLQYQYTPEDRRAWYFHQMITDLAYAKEIRVFNLGKIFTDRFRELRHLMRRARFRADYEHTAWDFAAQALSTLAVYGAFALIAYQTVTGGNTIGDLILFYQAFQRGQSYLGDLLNGLATLYENSLFLSSLYDFLDLERKIPEPVQPVPVPMPMKQGIVFDHVSFQYPNSTREALHDVSLQIEPGKVIALVGENGSGKTTLVKLLCRLYEPDSGQIRIDNIDLSNFNSRHLRQQISIIFQDYVKYNLTARENIWFGNVDIASSSEAITEAARRADAHSLINSLPYGYDTVLGKLFEQGEELSIGQWQKIALARAFLRNAQIIVLDEPTSALDPKAEYEVFLKFRELLNGRSAVLISHRLSTVRMADCIYVLDKGRIVEYGVHHELLQRAGVYADLFEKQAQYYR